MKEKKDSVANFVDGIVKIITTKGQDFSIGRVLNENLRAKVLGIGQHIEATTVVTKKGVKRQKVIDGPIKIQSDIIDSDYMDMAIGGVRGISHIIENFIKHSIDAVGTIEGKSRMSVVLLAGIELESAIGKVGGHYLKDSKGVLFSAKVTNGHKVFSKRVVNLVGVKLGYWFSFSVISHFLENPI